MLPDPGPSFVRYPAGPVVLVPPLVLVSLV
jgi:hypothetical protein